MMTEKYTRHRGTRTGNGRCGVCKQYVFCVGGQGGLPRPLYASSVVDCLCCSEAATGRYRAHTHTMFSFPFSAMRLLVRLWKRHISGVTRVFSAWGQKQ